MSSPKTETVSVEKGAAASQNSLLIAYLAGCDVSCPQCAYNLRDLQGNRCPECGEELMLQVNMAEPRQKLVIAGLIGLSAGVGFNGLLLLYVAITMLVLRGSWVGVSTIASVLGIGLTVEALLLWSWLRAWRRIRRCSTGLRATLMAGCWIVSLVDLVIFAVIVR